MDYIHSAHSVYMLTYHIVLVVKYRRKVITDVIGDEMKVCAAQLLNAQGCRLISAETDRDHMHLLVSMTPQTAPGAVITILKSRLSYMVRHRHSAYRSTGEIFRSNCISAENMQFGKNVIYAVFIFRRVGHIISADVRMWRKG